MGSFSELIPEDIFKNTFKQELIVGKIIHRFEYDMKRPDYKFSIIVGRYEDEEEITVARVFINTNINLNVINTDELKRLQVDILKRDYAFLSNEHSFIDCSKIKEIDCLELEQDYISSPVNFFKDNVSEGLFQRILVCLKNSKIIKPYLKKKYGLM